MYTFSFGNAAEGQEASRASRTSHCTVLFPKSLRPFEPGAGLKIRRLPRIASRIPRFLQTFLHFFSGGGGNAPSGTAGKAGGTAGKRARKRATGMVCIYGEGGSSGKQKQGRMCEVRVCYVCAGRKKRVCGAKGSVQCGGIMNREAMAMPTDILQGAAGGNPRNCTILSFSC